ncbi:hypothetical protein L1049_022324 [Liquidambar formosana]|uniref:Neprosin PEP catalytic domain-containing protein n=1 Tax=Liquidambar formosana TaxID=63359 RepID=A0AAP0WQ29_LIQFO
MGIMRKGLREFGNLMPSLKGSMALVLFVVLCLSGLSCYEVGGRSISRPEGMRRQTMSLHKPAAKKILSTGAYTVECVDINKQPAFDHPLLKNHKIQMKASFSSKGMKNEAPTTGKLSEFLLPGEGCPLGTVPIQRTPLDGQSNAKSLQKLGPGNINPLSDKHPGQHFATLSTGVTNVKYHGAQAVINVPNPTVKLHQVSMAQIWVQSGPQAELNSIQVGWAINPRLYNDTLTHFTAYWTADAFQKTGCYNLLCPGFVQSHRQIILGMPYDRTSVIGKAQYITNLKLLQDQSTGNWWLQLDNVINIGYWPRELFTHLADGATFIQYGGLTYNSPDGISPPMGTGLRPDKNESCYFSRLKIVDAKYNLVNTRDFKMGKYVDQVSCYDLKYWGNLDDYVGETFNFGGPGGSCAT